MATLASLEVLALIWAAASINLSGLETIAVTLAAVSSIATVVLSFHNRKNIQEIHVLVDGRFTEMTQKLDEVTKQRNVATVQRDTLLQEKKDVQDLSN